MLARSPSIAYVEEPFHPNHRPGVCPASPEHWYQYVTEENQAQTGYDAALQRTTTWRYSWGAELRALRSPRDVGRMLRDWSRFRAARGRGARALLKDPIAFFSAPWIARRFGSQVVVLTRHPAAFASSLKRLAWHFDVENWLAQPLLMEEVLAPWEDDLRRAKQDPGDVLDQAALVWRILALVTKDYQEAHPDWLFLRHEDLSLEPLEEYRRLFQNLGIPFDAAVEQALRETTSGDNPAEAPQGQAHALRRDSRANIANWKTRLSPEEVDRVRAGVEDAVALYYRDDEW